ncbi:MAG: cbb3-type cytochrome c oxidase subunit 3 [Pseudomonadota bacterium]
MTYESMRHFAGTWGLLLLIALFIGVVVYAFGPGSKARFRKAARLPLNDANGAPDDEGQSHG